MAPRHYLVTGAAGFIGRHFVARVLENEPDARVVVLDKLTYAGNPKNLDDFRADPRFSFVKGDICDAALVGELVGAGADVVVNFAAETHVDRAIHDPAAFIRTDVLGTHTLLEAVRTSKGCRFLQVSTDEVYGENLGDPSTESATLLPRNPYAASKAGADRLAYSYWATYGTPVCITRCSNNFGPFQYPEKMVPLFVTNALEGKPLPVYGDGRNTRDYLHVTDHVSAIHELIRAECFEGEVYNVAGREEHDILEVARLILQFTGKSDELIRLVKDRPGHDRRYAIDDTKIRERIAWRPRVAFEEGMERTVRWYSERREWWEPIKSGAFREYYRRQYGLEA